MESVFKRMLQQAKTLSDQKKFREAQTIYENWLQRHLDTPADDLDLTARSRIALIYNNIGQLKYLNVDFEEATEDYNKAITFDSELASAYFNRGTIFYRMGDFGQALGDMVKANELSPANAEFQLGLERTKQQLNGSIEVNANNSDGEIKS